MDLTLGQFYFILKKETTHKPHNKGISAYEDRKEDSSHGCRQRFDRCRSCSALRSREREAGLKDHPGHGGGRIG